MSLNILPFEVKYKLMATIERVGGEPIGLTCSDLFVVTWETFQEVSPTRTSTIIELIVSHRTS